MHHMFTPAGKKGSGFQLFLPVTCILHSKQESSRSTDNQDISIATQTALELAGDNISDDTGIKKSVALEKSKMETKKQKLKYELCLDDRDIDDTMTVDTQLKILEEIRQQKEFTQRLKGSTSSENYRATSTDQKFMQQNAQYHIPLHSGCSDSPILQAGEMEPLGHHLHVDRQEQQKYEDKGLQVAKQIGSPVTTFHSSSGKKNYLLILC